MLQILLICLKIKFLQKIYNIKRIGYLFCGCKDLENIFNIKILNNKLVIDMNNMFNGCENLKNLDGINKLNQIMLSI